MDIVISHEGTDFDGLAAMIAATKIYPGFQPVFPGKLSNQVKDFMALFKDQFPVWRVKDLDLAQVERIVLVDTKDPSRVGSFKELLFDERVTKIVYDHHLLDKDSFAFSFEDYTMAVGSTTTILVQMIKENDIVITPTEATLFALGIYHDTGCLTYTTTTAEDAEMVAFLLRNGASLNVVEEFVDLALNEAQQEVLNVLLDHMEQLIISGLRVDIYTAVLEEYLLGVNNIVHKLRDIREADLYFVIVEMDRRVLIVGRSDVDTVNLAHFFARLGGGGHPGAASATIKNAQMEEIRRMVVQLLHEEINLPRTAKDIMTTPVKTVTPDATIQQVEEIMARYGHSGLVVVDETGIKGVFSRRDLDKVKKNELADLPVKGYMTRKVITIAPMTPISEVQRLMVTHDIGRLPVVDEGGQLLGLVTRTDLLKVLYGERISVRQDHYYGGSLVKVNPQQYNLQHRLSQSEPVLYELFCQIRSLSQELGMRAYLVGGFVRDLFLQRVSEDLDLVVEGDGIQFARALHEVLGGKLDFHPEFGTANLVTNGFVIDIVTARIEYYEYPAALPHVEPGLLKQDLYRRDFTINTLAISLTRDNFGWLIDFFGGKNDLEQGVIRGLHSFTFIDDPTRILRGLKFAVRFGFTIEEDTDRLIHQAVAHKVFGDVKGPRLWEELKTLLLEGKDVQTFQYLEDYGILAQIANGLKLNEIQWAQLERVEQVVRLLKDGCPKVERWMLLLMVILADLLPEVADQLLTHWNLGVECRSRIQFTREPVEVLKERLSRTHLRNSELYSLLAPLHCEELMYLLLRSDSQLILDRVLDFNQRLRGIEVEITGKDMIELGFSPGPSFKEAITKVKEAKLNGIVKNRLEEIEYVKAYFKEKVGGSNAMES